ncbi:NAD(P)-binding protein [Corynespora cassiicola Philippines]|uniref:NAD(P)-binding protein n=1 Tax=Corynespora cassiicola Philippines TaxID=1448308 RepID=A0A2T2P280_CORCC|nr:NAD(P)-binding protein [Corynespora cassiicola Philippines]
MTKLVVIIGVTGNQGGSVANAFLQQPAWRVRGLTRDPESIASQHLSARGVEMVKADLHCPDTLKNVFNGANLVFSVTDFWMPYFDPINRTRAQELGKTIGQYAYELELEQGRNIVDAVAKEVDGLDRVGFIASTLSSARKCSHGRYKELWHFDSKADIFPDYVEENYPDLAKKMSYLHTGYFFTSWKILPNQWFAKVGHLYRWISKTVDAHRLTAWQMSDKSIEMRFPTHRETIVPHLDPRKDTGNFVRALLQLPPNSTVMAASEWCTWPEWLKTWGDVTGVKTNYRECTVEDFDHWMPGGMGKEIGDMYEYSNDPGYDGGDPRVLRTQSLKEMGIAIPTTSLREYCETEDWVQAGIIS